MMGVTSVAGALCWALLVTLAHGLPHNDVQDWNPDERGDGPEVNPVDGFTPGPPFGGWGEGDINDGNPMVGFTPTPPASKTIEDPLADDELRHEFKIELSSDGEMMMEGTYQGDIMLTPEQQLELKERRVITYASYLWPNKNIPYRFGDNTINRPKTTEAIDHWREHTCLTFTEVADNFQGHHLILINAGGCASYVGRIPSFSSGQNVWLARGCVNEVGPTVHEIFHAAGSFHEQSRSDRDSYVQILFQNIQPGKENNFNKHNTINYAGYDYHSIMHYGLKYFSKNGLPTILPLNLMYTPLIGNRVGFTFRDKKTANAMYKCTDMWLSQCGISTNPCKNEGYIGKNCTCVCHPGTAGTNCETLNQEYNDAMLAIVSPGTETIRDERTITSEGYPQPDQDGSSFMKLIIAPNCYKVKLVIVDFYVYGRQSGLCRIDYMNIKMDMNGTGNVCPDKDGNDIQNGDKSCIYCGREMPLPGTFTSVGDRIILTYKSYNYTTAGFQSPYKGFKGIITHEKIPGCDTDTTTTTTTTGNTTSTTTSSTTTEIPPPPSPLTFINRGDIPIYMAPGNYCQTAYTRTTVPEFNYFGTNYTYSYTSPGYPGYAKANSTCHDIFFTTEPRYLNVTIETNHLHDGDKLGLIHSHMVKWFTRSSSLVNFIVPSAVGIAVYGNNPNKAGYGFKINVTVLNSRCHGVLNITGNIDTGEMDATLLGPSMKDGGAPNPICEFWFIVPEGKRIKLEISNFSVGSSAGDGDYLLFDTAGDITYMTAPVKYFGDLSSAPFSVTSDGRYMPMLFYGMNGPKGNFSMSITLINGTSREINPEATKLTKMALDHETIVKDTYLLFE